MSKPHKIIITGTGRSGTTFLIRLLGELGLDTGFDKKRIEKELRKNCNAGLEQDYGADNYIIKNPRLSDKMKEINKHYEIDLVIVPVRDLKEAAQSRINYGEADGGLWLTDTPEEQEAKLAEQLGILTADLVLLNIPYKFMKFPQLVDDPKYTYDKLYQLFTMIPYNDFKKTFNNLKQKTRSDYYEDSVRNIVE